MARIAGIDLPRDKAVLYALPVLYGIGKHNVHELVEKAGIDPRKKIRDLDEMEIGRIREVLDKDFQVEGDLRREVQGNIRRLMEIGCYPGHPPPARPPHAGPEHAPQRPHPQGQAEDRRRQEEGEEVRQGVGSLGIGPDCPKTQ